ncbi:MAG: sigma-70 family RNA polymerase sigma factor [Bacteroidota bacterium]
MWEYHGPYFSEAELVERLQGTQAQCSEALRCLYHQNRDKILALIRSKKGNQFSLEEVMSVGLHGIASTVRRQQYRQEAQLGSLLYTICKNYLNKELSRQPTMILSYGDENLPELPESDTFRPDFQMIANQHADLIQRLLDQVGEKCRELLLRTFDRSERMKTVAKDLGFANVQLARNQKTHCKGKVLKLIRETPALQQLINDILG